MASAVDWETLKPKILRLLSAGRTRKDVIEEISRDGSSITLVSHLIHFICPVLTSEVASHNLSTSLSAGAGEPTSRSMRGGTPTTKCKSERETRSPAQSSSMALSYHITKSSRKPGDMIVRRCSLHQVASLIPTFSRKWLHRVEPQADLSFATASPKCPEGFDLVICTPPSSANAHHEIRSVSPEVRHSFLDLTGKISPLPWLKFKHEFRSTKFALRYFTRYTHLCLLLMKTDIRTHRNGWYTHGSLIT